MGLRVEWRYLCGYYLKGIEMAKITEVWDFLKQNNEWVGIGNDVITIGKVEVNKRLLKRAKSTLRFIRSTYPMGKCSHWVSSTERNVL